MTEGKPPPHPDDALLVRHPRENPDLFGQERAEAAFLQSWKQGRIHHAWLICGPRGVGKATLAWRIARFVRAGGEGETLFLPPEHPTFRRVAAMGESGIVALARPVDEKAAREGGPARLHIGVDEIRALKAALSLSEPEGAWRVLIVDPAEAMNRNAANALLKSLEEPPARTLFLLVSHAAAHLPATVRSRCRVLPCVSLSPDTMHRAIRASGHPPDSDDTGALIALADGAPGRFWHLADADAKTLQENIDGILTERNAPLSFRLSALLNRFGEKGAVSETLYEAVQYILAHRLAEKARDAIARGARAEANRWAEHAMRAPLSLMQARRANLDRARSVRDALYAITSAGAC